MIKNMPRRSFLKSALIGSVATTGLGKLASASYNSNKPKKIDNSKIGRMRRHAIYMLGLTGVDKLTAANNRKIVHAMPEQQLGRFVDSLEVLYDSRPVIFSKDRSAIESLEITRKYTAKQYTKTLSKL